MKRAVTAALAALALAYGATAAAGQFYGGKGFLHTNAALVLPPGALDLCFYVRGYVGPVSGENWFVTNGTSAFASTFGFSRRVELGFTQVLYQDLNATPRLDKATVIIPGNTYIRFKIAGYPLGDNMFWGVMPGLRYRVGKFQNLHLEPYASEGIEAELGGLLSYYVKPLYPDEAPSFHLNFAYLNHNDGSTPTDGAQEFNYLVSSLLPRPRFDYGFELYGANFIKRPEAYILGRENWMYATPFVRYKLFKGLHFTAGLDVLLIGNKDATIPTTDPMPNYSRWRITGKINFTPSTAFYAAPTFVKSDATGTGRERRTFAAGAAGGGGGGESPMFSRQELFRWGIEERGGEIQSVDLDLEKLRQERKKAEEELKQLKLKLEERQKAEQQK